MRSIKLVQGFLGLTAAIFIIVTIVGVRGAVGTQWCNGQPIPSVEIRSVRVDGNRVFVNAKPRGAVVLVSNQLYATEGILVNDGRHTVEAKVTEVYRHPFAPMAQMLGYRPSICSKTGTTHHQVVVDTTGPQLTGLQTELVGTIVHVTGSVNEFSDQFQVSITGFEPVAFTGSEFALTVPLERATSFEVQLSISDGFGNSTASQWFSLPLPASRWERYVDGKLVQVTFSRPAMPFYGWGLSQWRHISNNNVLETLSTPLWLYALVAVFPLAAVGFVMAVAAQTAKHKRRQVHKQRLARAKAAFQRLNNGTYAWARQKPLLPFEIEQLLDNGFLSFKLRASRLRRYAQDVQLVAEMWPNSKKIKPFKQNVNTLQRHFRSYERVIAMAETRRLIPAWGLVLTLPGELPVFQLLQHLIAKKTFGVLVDLIDPNETELSPFILDAVGIIPKSGLLRDLTLLHTEGNPLPVSTKQKVNALYELFLARTKQVGSFGPEWKLLITAQVDAITLLGVETFVNYLLEYTKNRQYSDL